MGIVFSHAVVSLFLFYRNPQRFLLSGGRFSSRKFGPEDLVQDALRLFDDIKDFNQLHNVIVEALKALVSQPVNAAVFVADPDVGDLCAKNQTQLPRQGICWECIQKKEDVVCCDITEDPILSILQEHSPNPQDGTHLYVHCSPVVDEDTAEVIVVLVFSSESELPVDISSLMSLKQKIVGCYRHLCKCRRDNSANYMPANTRSSDSPGNYEKESILKLCGDLYDQDATRLQLKVVKFLAEQTNAQCCFLLLVVPETHELFCQVIGDRVLQEEVKFPGQSSSFAMALETKKPMMLSDIPLDKRKGIEEFIDMSIKSFLCVPVTSRTQDSLIALACVVNKEGSDNFTNEDVQSILQCFQYTATVLTNTLAFQNERKLKIQTQAMLQVARNLFTHLGEFSKKHRSEYNNYPYLAEFLHMYREQEPTYVTHRKSKSFVNCNGSARVQKLDNINKMIDFGDRLAEERVEVQNDTFSRKIYSEGSSHLNNDELPEMKDGKKRFFTENLIVDEIGNLTLPIGEGPGISTGSICEDGKDMPRNTETEEENASDDEMENLMLLESGAALGGRDSPYSFRSAISEVTGDMYSAVDTLDVEYRRPDSPYAFPIEEEEVPSKRWSPKSNTPNDSKSDSCVAENDEDSTLLEASFQDIPDADFSGSVEARLSHSEPSFSTINVEESSSSITLPIIESKPEFNYAFMDESSNESLDKEECPSELPVSTMQLLGYEVEETGSPIDVVIEDTEAKSFHVISVHQNSHTATCTSPSAQTLDQSTNNEIRITFPQFQIQDVEKGLKLQLPSTEAILVTMNDLTKLLREIMQEARNLTQAERCSVFLIDRETDELVAKVFDGITKSDSEEQAEIRMPITQGIAGHVATTGNLLNIKDAYSHPLFYRGIDDSTGFKTRNILCFPIKNERGDVLGVAQLCNKKTGPYFTTFDEDVASAFAVYCCISISHSLMYQNVLAAQCRNSLANELMMYHMKCLMYKKLQDSQHRNRLANELMIYHMQIAPEEVEVLIHTEIPPVKRWGEHFEQFHFPPREIPDNDTALNCIAMFEDLGFIQRWRIKKETLARFILMVKKGYRNPPYHNWMHAFAVAHFCYLCIKNLNLTEHLDDIELFALFVSCLCHDIDHRGTNNQYQMASKSVLAALYSSEGSVMERHHFAQTMCIVNTEGCNIFENLSSKDYTAGLDLMRDIILATDLAHHLKIMGNLKELAKVGYQNSNSKHHKLLLCLLMTASDLSDQTKPWDNTKHVAALIYREFFSQGDMEKSLGQKPAEMMDRERARIPDLQIGFLDHIALPVYVVLGDIFPAANTVRTTVEDNRRHWEKICTLIKIRRGGSCEQMSYDQILALEEEEANAEIETYHQQNGR